MICFLQFLSEIAEEAAVRLTEVEQPHEVSRTQTRLYADRLGALKQFGAPFLFDQQWATDKKNEEEQISWNSRLILRSRRAVK